MLAGTGCDAGDLPVKKKAKVSGADKPSSVPPSVPPSAVAGVAARRRRAAGPAQSSQPPPEALKAQVQFTATSFNRRAEGRKAITECLLQGFQRFRVGHRLDAKDGAALNLKGKIIRDSHGHALTWKTLGKLAFTYFTAKYHGKTSVSFGLAVYNDYRQALGNLGLALVIFF